mgnify:CR=1 FL=1
MSVESGDQVDGIVPRGQGDVVVEAELSKIAAAVAVAEFSEQCFGVVGDLSVKRDSDPGGIVRAGIEPAAFLEGQSDRAGTQAVFGGDLSIGSGTDQMHRLAALSQLAPVLKSISTKLRKLYHVLALFFTLFFIRT